MKQVEIDVSLMVADTIDEQDVVDLVDWLLSDITEDDGYESVTVRRRTAIDESAIELLDMLDEIDYANIQTAKDIIDDMEDDDE